jgi:hypothetical protein
MRDRAIAAVFFALEADLSAEIAADLSRQVSCHICLASATHFSIRWSVRDRAIAAIYFRAVGRALSVGGAAHGSYVSSDDTQSLHAEAYEGFIITVG